MDIVVEPVRTPPLRERITHVLRVNIISGGLAPGDHLVETQLAEQFDVSRGPVRDALRQLEVEGLAESHKGRYYVVGVTDDDIDELYAIRHALELLAVEACMRTSNKDDFAVFDAVIEDMYRAAKQHRPLEFAAADVRFHSLFYELSGHTRLLNIWEQIRPTFSLLMETSTEQDVDLNPSAEAHQLLIDEVRGSDISTTLVTVEQHLAGSKERIVRARHRTPSHEEATEQSSQ